MNGRKEDFFMKDLVRIKSFSKGLTLRLDDQVLFEDLLSEVAAKFTEGKAFFGKESVAISFTGRKLSEIEQIRLMDAIQSHCDLKVLCIVEQDEAQDKVFVKSLQHAEFQKLAETELDKEIQVFHGSLQDGEEVETPNSIVVFGDVEAGCAVTSEKNVLILGSLYGTAKAGAGEDGKNCIVAALEMTPEALAIGDFKYTPPKTSKWGKKKKGQALTARIREDAIVMEELTKEHLRDF